MRKKTSVEIFKKISNHLGGIDDDILLADGFEEALIGTVDGWFPAEGGGCGRRRVALYDYEKCVEILVKRDGMSRDDAVEHLEFNTLGAYMGPGTPAFALIYREPKLSSLP